MIPVNATQRWYEEQNPPGTPQPRLDLGDCTPHGREGQSSVELERGFICDGVDYPFLVSLDPIVTSASDMLKYWKQYDDNDVQGEGGSNAKLLRSLLTEL